MKYLVFSFVFLFFLFGCSLNEGGHKNYIISKTKEPCQNENNN